MSIRWYILGVFVSIFLGIAMTFAIYFYAVFIYALPILCVVALLIVVISLVKKDSNWKMAVQILSLCFFAAITAKLIYRSLEMGNRKRRDEVVSAIYRYRQIKAKFPIALEELPNPIRSVRCNYNPDSTFNSFKLYVRDIYGIPRLFTSKDSLWQY